MRLPTEKELSPEQREVIFAPPEGTALVVGPPGSGKTVVALFRAKFLERELETFCVIMYTKVLKKYTGMESRTGLHWIGEWWRLCRGSGMPEYKVRVDGYGGPRWQRKWDFERASEILIEEPEAFRRKGHWGHLILDEAQDFPPGYHRLLYCVQEKVFEELDEAARPSLLVLADENQRITAENSTIEEMKRAYLLNEADVYSLEKNYRNTREIAEFASHFFVGLRSGMPKLPEKRGEKPVVAPTNGIDDAVGRVARYARSHEASEIAVLVNYERTRKKLVNKLRHRLKDSSIDVQTYSSQDRSAGNAEVLEFERVRIVTVLCYASAKGLEFDAVFLPELQSIRVDGEQLDVTRMNLYVMCSRARTHLFLFVSEDPERKARIWGLLPPGGRYVLQE